jgi:ABC-type branched-subunit amino acid transport system permease subunit
VGFTVYWQALLGIVLVILVLVLPTGIVGTSRLLVAAARRRFAR